MTRNRAKTTAQPKTVKQDVLANIDRLQKENLALKQWIVEYRQTVQAEREGMAAQIEAQYQELSKKIAELEAQLAKTASRKDIENAFVDYSHNLLREMTGVFR